jgi:hypothetical protein
VMDAASKLVLSSSVVFASLTEVGKLLPTECSGVTDGGGASTALNVALDGGTGGVAVDAGGVAECAEGVAAGVGGVAVDTVCVAACAGGVADGVGCVAVGVGVILAVLLPSLVVVVFSLTNLCVAASDFSEADVWGREADPSIAARLTEREVVTLLD